MKYLCEEILELLQTLDFMVLHLIDILDLLWHD